ncbi:STY4534 family ICE replication protein [Pseudomonas sp. MWU12-2345]|uniref:STY4534 family ICE replication protein n=1 Tax=Pseudomonas sp. MWU12-2345 TaxID=2928689 RepID=UPI00200BC9FC|nr:STY4534 family ICE replication protein [Pseudomonas sp. MWU12-2345]
MSNQTNETKFFDLHTTGIGYLNRIREVSVRKGKPFMAVTVAALRGSSDEVEYTYIDCNVVGEEAERLIRRCQDAVNNKGKKVLVSFRIGDIWPDTFTYDKGDKIGKTGVSLKGRLLFIGWVKVDGETVYEAKPREVAIAAEQGQEQATPEAPLESSNAPEPVAEEQAKPAATPAKRQRRAS